MAAIADRSTDCLTIAIPFYTGQEYLRRAIESVLRQSSSAWQLIVVDDVGPETGTQERAAQVNDSRIRYLRNHRNLGMALNWNRCLDLAETDLVNLLHNDDELLPNYVETMLRAARDHPDASAFFCRARVIDAEGRDCFSFVDYVKRFLEPKGTGPIVLRGKSAVEALMHGDFIMCPTVCYRKSRLLDERFCADWRQVLDLDFFVRILVSGGKMIGIPDGAYAYRRHTANATSANTASLLRFEEEARIHEQVASICLQRGWYRAEGVARRMRVIQAHLLFTVVKNLGGFRFRSAANAWRFLIHLLRGARVRPDSDIDFAAEPDDA